MMGSAFPGKQYFRLEIGQRLRNTVETLLFASSGKKAIDSGRARFDRLSPHIQ